MNEKEDVYVSQRDGITLNMISKEEKKKIRSNENPLDITPYFDHPESITPEKKCIRCEEIKTLSDFPLDRSRKSGYKEICNVCDMKRTIDNRDRKMINRNISFDKKNGLFTKHEDYYTPDELMYLLDSSLCYYCGGGLSPRESILLLHKHYNDKKITNKLKKQARGLDRIDNNKGHQKDNVIVACGFCNTARSNIWSVEQFKVARRIQHLTPEQIGMLDCITYDMFSDPNMGFSLACDECKHIGAVSYCKKMEV